MQNMREAAVFTGFHCKQRKKHACIAELNEFFEQEMGINPHIEDIFFLGQGQYRPIVITFATMADKSLVFKKLDLIKDLINNQGQGLFFNDYLPAAMSERKRRDGEIFKINEQQEQADKLDMSLTYTGLKIKGSAYVPTTNGTRSYSDYGHVSAGSG